MLSAINVIDRKLHFARLKSLKEIAETGEFVNGGRFVHSQSFAGPMLGVFFEARVTRQPQTTNAIRAARKIPSSRLSAMPFSVARWDGIKSCAVTPVVCLCCQ